MSGVIVAPTSVGWQNQQLLSGQVNMVPGNGVVGRTMGTPAQLYIDSQFADPVDVFPLFVPGQIAAQTIGVWKNTRAKQTAQLLVMEANFLTAQTTSDAANYYELKASDSSGKTAVLPFTAVASHFYLNQNYGALIATNMTDPGATQGNNYTSMATGFVPSQNLTVSGLQMRTAISGGSLTFIPWPGGVIRATILTADMKTILASALWTMPSGAGSSNLADFVFAVSVALSQGTTYVLMFDTELSGPLSGHTLPMIWSPSPVASGVLTGLTSVDVTISKWLQTAPVGNSIQQAIAALQASPNSHPILGNGGPAYAGFMGSPGGTIFGGDITLSISSVGAPVSTAAGSNLNCRLLLA